MSGNGKTSNLIQFSLNARGPAVVLTDCLKSYISRRIKLHTHGDYSHAMLLLADGRLISQDAILRVVDFAHYISGRHRVKLWGTAMWDEPVISRAITAAAERSLKRPVSGRLYDWLGIVGQYLRMPGINNPNRTFCSEFVRNILAAADSRFSRPKHPSPCDIDRKMASISDAYVIAIYDPNGEN